MANLEIGVSHRAEGRGGEGAEKRLCIKRMPPDPPPPRAEYEKNAVNEARLL